MEILSGGMGSESKLLKMVKTTKDPKQAKTGGKDGKTAAGGGAQGPATGGAADADKGQAAEVMPVEAPPAVGTGFLKKKKKDQLIKFCLSLRGWNSFLLNMSEKGNLNVSRWILTESRSLCFSGRCLKPP